MWTGGEVMATTFESISLQGLRVTHLQQLQSYIYARESDQDGYWYYGNKKQFEKRHNELKTWINNAVDYATSEGAKMPKEKK